MSKEKILISNRLSNKLELFKENKVVQLLLSLRDNGVEVDNLIINNNWVNYLNLKDNGDISYIKTSSLIKNNVSDPWHKSRQNCSFSQVVNRILSENYILSLKKSGELKQTDFEQLNAMYRAEGVKNCKIEILRGFQILEAFNFKGNLNTNKINSCANFRKDSKSTYGSYADPLIKWFYPYIYNKSCFAIIVKDEKNEIKARTIAFEGFQLVDSGQLKKGVKYKFYNNIFSEDSVYSQMIINYCKQNTITCFSSTNDCFMINFKSHYKTWPPFDSFFVDKDKNILFTRSIGFDRAKYKLTSAYKLVIGDGNHLGKNGTKEVYKKNLNKN